MRTVRAGVIGLVVLAIFVTLFSLLFPSNVRVSRAVDIHASREAVWQFLVKPEKWPEWYMPIKSDSTHDWKLNGNVYSKEGYSLKITPVSDTSVGIIAISPKEEMNATIQVIGDGKESHCTVQWYTDIPVRWYPWEKFGSILFDKIVGGGMEISLQSLKEGVELPK